MHSFVSTEVKVRFADCDMMGHVNNAHFLTYMEQGRVEYFKKFPELNFLELKRELECSLILAEISCTFKSPAYLNEILVVSLGTTELKRSSIVMEYEMKEKTTGRLVAIGRSVGVYYDYQQKKSVSLPESIRKRFEEIEGRKF